MPFLAAGIVPLAWAVASLGDRALRHVVALHEREYPVQLLPTVAVALATAAGGWWNLPELRANEAVPIEHWTALFLAGGTLVLAIPWWLGRPRRGATAQDEAHMRAWRMLVDYGMLALAAVFLSFAWSGVLEERGFRIAFIILCLAAFGLWLTSRRRDILGMPEHPGIPHRASKPLGGPFKLSLPTACAIGINLGALVALTVGFAKWPLELGDWMGTLAIVFIGLALWSFFAAMWVYLPKLAGWPALGLLPILWFVLVAQPPDHSLRGTSYERPEAKRPRLDEHFAQWRENTLPAQDRPIFFVAAAGGGVRAAFWTATVLAAADDATCGEFGRHIYAYSGVSGGALGVSAYLAQRQVWEERKQAEGNVCLRGRKDEIARMLGRDFLGPVAGSMLFAEPASRFVFSPLENDRGATLARAWSRAWDEQFGWHGAATRFDTPFVDVFAAIDEGQPGPAVYLNATGADSGRRVVASNVAPVRDTMPGIVDLLREERRVPLKTNELPLREAVLNSARFTYVSPAGEVRGCYGELVDGRCPHGKERIWERLVDGGYFENSGVATLADVIHALGAALPKQNAFVIVIDNSSDPVLACRPAGVQSRSELKAEEHPDSVPPFSGLTAPIEAFLHVREARARLEVRRLRAEFSCEQGRILDWNLFGDKETQKEAIEAQQQPPLGWFLSTRSAKWMLGRVDEVAGKLPFQLAPCHSGPLTHKVRGLLGGEAFRSEHCAPQK
jgi:hypothetical protein